MKQLIALFLLFFASVSFGQTIISGTIRYAPNEKIRVVRVIDYISNREEVVTTTDSDSAGNFFINLEIKKATYLTLSTEYYKAGFYVSPATSYKVKFLEKDSGAVVTMGRPIPVGLEMIHPVNDSINGGIKEVNAVIDSFFSKNYELFILKAAKPVVNKFKPVVTKRFSTYHPIVKTYLKYAFAPIDEAVFRDRVSMYNEYFSGPVLYDNQEYLDYFNQYFIKYLHIRTLGKCESQFNSALNVSRSFDELTTAIKTCDTLVKNDTLAQLIALKGLYELYEFPKQSKENIRIILDKASRASNGLTANVATNILHELTYLKEGTKAPFAEVTDINGKPVNLDSYKGKYVYLFFWASWCDPCMQELKVLQSLKEKYERKIVFFGVSIDGDLEDVKRSVTRNKFDWVTVHDKEQELRQLYRLKAVPKFYMIDPDGDFLATPPVPSENLKGYFENIIRKK